MAGVYKELAWFQSTPASHDAGDEHLSAQHQNVTMFQSTPASHDAGDLVRHSQHDCPKRFNPLPRRMTRETMVRLCRMPQHGCFNPLPRRMTRETSECERVTDAIAFQSTPASHDAGDLEVTLSDEEGNVSIHSRVA